MPHCLYCNCLWWCCRSLGCRGYHGFPRFNPISTRRQIMPTTSLLASPDFQTFLRPCMLLPVGSGHETSEGGLFKHNCKCAPCKLCPRLRKIIFTRTSSLLSSENLDFMLKKKINDRFLDITTGASLFEILSHTHRVYVHCWFIFNNNGLTMMRLWNFQTR